jgi:hypothetical protein
MIPFCDGTRLDDYKSSSVEFCAALNSPINCPPVYYGLFNLKILLNSII